MNILIIGNGFDLAHGLPTTYKDFLDFITTYDNYVKNLEVGVDGQKDLEILEGKDYEFLKYIIDMHNNKKFLSSEFEKLISNNYWINYFERIDTELCRKGKIGWIDFEREISKVIQTVESVQKRIENSYLVSEETKLISFEFDILKNFTSNIKILDTIGTIDDKKEELEKIKERLVNDLNSLIRVLEIYLSDFINNLPVKKRLPDIEELKIDKVLSFNYTSTYERLYGKDNQKIEYDYIHGKADINHNINNCNMVLGIDEYLTGEERNKNTEFIQFKKFFQRIYKKTGCKYTDWLSEYFRENDKGVADVSADELNIYIFGHSLDFTDKDILRELILCEGYEDYYPNLIKGKIKIFHFNQVALGSQIANLLKVIGQDNLISKVHGDNARIILQQQQDTKSIEDEKGQSHVDNLI